MATIYLLGSKLKKLYTTLPHSSLFGNNMFFPWIKQNVFEPLSHVPPGECKIETPCSGWIKLAIAHYDSCSPLVVQLCRWCRCREEGQKALGNKRFVNPCEAFFNWSALYNKKLEYLPHLLRQLCRFRLFAAFLHFLDVGIFLETSILCRIVAELEPARACFCCSRNRFPGEFTCSQHNLLPFLTWFGSKTNLETEWSSLTSHMRVKNKMLSTIFFGVLKVLF